MKKVSRTESVYSYPKPGYYPVTTPTAKLTPEQERRKALRLQRAAKIAAKGNWEKPESAVANRLKAKLMGG